MKSRALMCAVLLVSVVGCGSRTDPVEFSGELSEPARWIDGEKSGEPIVGVGLSEVRGTVIRGTLTGLSDDRVNGDIEALLDIDFFVEGDRTTGLLSLTSVIITNAGGTWVGTGEGTTTWTRTDPEHLHSIDHTLLGTGDYEGLQLTYHVEGVDYPWDLTGTIEPVDS